MSANRPVADTIPPAGYMLRQGTGLDRALLVKFMQRTYQEIAPGHAFAHLAQTVEQYFSADTPVWWVDRPPLCASVVIPVTDAAIAQPIGCLWLGSAIDQVEGDRHSHIFLLYVAPACRRQGIGAALIRQAEAWAVQRGDRQIGLHVFQSNQPAINLYAKLGYSPQSLWMVKPLS